MLRADLLLAPAQSLIVRLSRGPASADNLNPPNQLRLHQRALVPDHHPSHPVRPLRRLGSFRERGLMKLLLPLFEFLLEGRRRFVANGPKPTGFN